MAEVDKEELRRAAEAAPKGDWTFDCAVPERSYCAQVWDSDGEDLAVLRATEQGSYAAQHIAAANPSVVLSLLDESDAQAARIAELERECERLRLDVKNRKHTIDGMNEAHWDLVQAHAQLRSELEAFRKDAERYRFLRISNSSGKVDFCVAKAFWGFAAVGGVTRYVILTGDEADAAVDAAMKEAASDAP